MPHFEKPSQQDFTDRPKTTASCSTPNDSNGSALSIHDSQQVVGDLSIARPEQPCRVRQQTMQSGREREKALHLLRGKICDPLVKMANALQSK